jgi:hypothetical protein
MRWLEQAEEDLRWAKELAERGGVITFQRDIRTVFPTAFPPGFSRKTPPGMRFVWRITLSYSFAQK